MSDTELNLTNVDKLFRYCLFTDEEAASMTREELTKQAVVAKGVVMTAGFNPTRVQEVTTKVDALLEQLDPTFSQGWSFLNIPFRADGEQWGEHQNADQLLMLGLATGRLAYLVEDRTLWSGLPAGMPYVILKPKERIRDESDAVADMLNEHKFGDPDPDHKEES